MGFVARSRHFVVSALPGLPPSQVPTMAQNGSLGAFFVTVLGSSWGPPSQVPKMVQNGSLESFFVKVLGSSWDPLSQVPKMAQNGSLEAFSVTVLGWTLKNGYMARVLVLQSWLLLCFYMFAWPRSARNCNLTVNLRVSGRQVLQKYYKIRMSGRLGSRKYAKICVSGRLGEQEYDRNALLLCFYMFLSYV